MLDQEAINSEQIRAGNPAWKPGVSGNPAGRPKGARNKATLMAEAMLDGDVEGITRSAIALAKAGDPRAIRLCLDRLCAPRRDRHVSVDLPPVECAADAVRASAALLQAVAEGALTPAEAAPLGRLVELCLRGLEAKEREAAAAAPPPAA